MTIINFNRSKDFEIPKQVLDNLTANEEFFFNLKTKSVLAIVNFMKYFIPIMELGMILGIFTLFLQKDFDFLANSFQILMAFTAIVIGFAFWFIITKTSFGITTYQLIITNKAVYLFKKYSKTEDLEKLDLFSIKTIILRKKKTIKDSKDMGTIDFIWEMGKSLCVGRRISSINRTTIKCVPDVSANLKLIESIFLHFGNIYERWEKIKSDMNIKIPCEFESSKDVLSKLNRRVKIYNIFQFMYWIFLIIGFIFIFTSNRILWVTSLLIIAFSISCIISDLNLNFNLRRVAISQDNTLQLYNNKIILINKGILQTFNFNPNFLLDFRILRYRFIKKGYSFIGIIKIKLSPESSIKAKLGPYKDYMQKLEIIYLNYLFWKNNQKLLQTKEKLIELKKLYLKPVSRKIRSKQEKKIITWNNFQEIPLDSIILPNDKIQEIRNHLNPNEKILTTYKPYVKNKKTIISIILLIVGIISLVLLLFDFIYNSILYSPILTIPGFLLTMITPIVIYSELSIKKSFFIFTNQKLIAVYSKNYIKVLYANISSIILEKKRKSNEININLKPLLEDDLKADVNSISLSYLPKESDLYEKLIFLKNEAIKNKSLT